VRQSADVGFGEGGTGGVRRGQSGAGEIIQGTGGVRKIRWALEGMGKRRGARVIYRKANLSKAGQSAMKRLVPALVAGYPRKA
jgi:hypothetical protein